MVQLGVGIREEAGEMVTYGNLENSGDLVVVGGRGEDVVNDLAGGAGDVGRDGDEGEETHFKM